MNRVQNKKQPVPEKYRLNFRQLYLDIAWFGVLSGSTVGFLSVYMAHLGASAFQIGLLNATPAVVTLFLALPAGRWLRGKPIDWAVFWSSVGFRIFYLTLVPLPFLFSSPTQIWVIVLITFSMSIPGTILAVGFNALFAQAVPEEYRGRVVGVRNALLAITSTSTTLVCGFFLNRLPFLQGYPLVFLLGFIGAAMSSLHLKMVRVTPEQERRPKGIRLSYLTEPGFFRSIGDAIRPGPRLRELIRYRWRLPRFYVLRSPFGVILFLLLGFHLAQFLAIPLFPIYWVERLHLTDQDISMGNALFFLLVFLGSTQLSRLVERFGNHNLFVIGALLMSAYPGLTAVTRDVGMFLFASVVGGIAWSLAGGTVGNYLLEKIPEDERPSHLAWYTVILNFAILIGSLAGPFIARHVGMIAALVIGAACRFLAGLALWRWGR
ncbi:MAG: MFS transporter [Chloroflexota bacterium]